MSGAAQRRATALVLGGITLATGLTASFAPPHEPSIRTAEPAGPWRLEGFSEATPQGGIASLAAGTGAELWRVDAPLYQGERGRAVSPWTRVPASFSLLVRGGGNVSVETREGAVVRIPPAGPAWRAWHAPPGLADAAIDVRIAAAADGQETGVSAPFWIEGEPMGGAEMLVRTALSLLLAAALVLLPGLALRACSLRAPRSLAFLPLPGLALLVLTGGACWLLAPTVGPQRAASAILLPVLLACTVVAARRPLLFPEEWRIFALYLTVVSLATARAAWSPLVENELYGGRISRTLETGDRSDSRVSFHTVQVIARGDSPYSSLSAHYYAPWSFSHRGPLAGMAAAPLVFLSGARPPAQMPDQPWHPFDPEGFAAYRIAMISFAALCILICSSLAARLGGDPLAAAALVAATPFVVHETFFTWPKLLAGSLVLLSLALAVRKQPLRGGALLGAAYLVHPLALFSLPVAGLGMRKELRALLLFFFGVAAAFAGWRLVNGPHFAQADFVAYLLQSDKHAAQGPADWLAGRALGLANTLLPLASFLYLLRKKLFQTPLDAFVFQYWLSAPFALGAIALPVFARRLLQADREVLFIVLIVPLLVFAGYWGGAATGLMREGLHAWALCLLLICAVAPARARWETVLLDLRTLEILALLILPAGLRLATADFAATDSAALVAMVLLTAALFLQVRAIHRLAR